MRPAQPSEVRELARRSRHTQRVGTAAIVLALLVAPLAVALGEKAALAGVVLGGLMLVLYARAAGQERGAYRALFRALRSDGHN